MQLNNKLPKKLYVVVRKDLTPSQSAVQAGHALAEYMLNCGKWRNSTLIYLGVENLRSLDRVKDKLDMRDIAYYEFKEPDIGDQPTALACDVECSVFDKLDLL